MQPRYRFLQTVVREPNGDEREDDNRYRYDLVAHCPSRDRHYIIRAHKTRPNSRDTEETREEVAIARGIRGCEESICEVFLDIAHARDPVDPVHLPEILEDRSDEAMPGGVHFERSHCLSEYYYYDQMLGIREG